MPITLNHYQIIRQHFIKILGGKCSKCETIENLELDHIAANGWGMSRGRDVRMWEWFLSYSNGNLQLLCGACNKEKHHSQHKPID